MQRFVFTCSATLHAKVIVMVLLAACPFVYAQTPPPTRISEFSAIIPPSPTVAGFMKFEEVPVNNYTGIPDISIPIYSIGTHSKDINIDISLRYHPASIAVEEDASYVGLGWSLFSGGTISRTMRGLPDEQFHNDMYGVHNETNSYYDVKDLFGLENKTPQQEFALSDFIWNVGVLGKYDSQHDLYQFNFMGHSGRFIITKEYGEYTIKKLDNDNAININYDSNNQIFTLYDDKGYKYVFDVKEESTSFSISNRVSFKGNTFSSSAQPQIDYISAFHLSKIYDGKDNLLVEFKFNDNVIYESSFNRANTRVRMEGLYPDAVIDGYDMNCPDSGSQFLLEPKTTNTLSSTSTKTKKVTQIDIKDIATITFATETGRDDSNNTLEHRLKSITVTNKRGQQIKRIELFHDYSTTVFNPANPSAGFTTKRMILTKVTEQYDTKTLSYEMDYLKRRDELDMIPFFKDYWGYTTAKPDYGLEGEFRETHPFFCKMDILQKMKLPTGGAIIYQFEPNTYSYIGKTPITDFSTNPFNWVTDFQSFFPKEGTGSSNNNLNYFDYDVNVVFVNNGLLGTLFKDINGVWTPQTDYGAGDYVLEGGYHYKISIPNFQGQSPGGYVTVNYFHKREPEYKFLLGGGVRIAKIGYFDNGSVYPLYYDADENPVYYENASYKDYPPQKEKNYNYHFSSDTSRSSGSLVFAKPVFDYSYSKKINVKCRVGGPDGGTNIHDIVESFDYTAFTDFNNLKTLRTKGCDVGYKNVKVTETGNGFSRYEYTSPIDTPESDYFGYPFTVTPNKDYARGLLTREKHFNEQGDSLSVTTNQYKFVEGTLKTGIDVWIGDNCPFINDYNGSHALYYGVMENCIIGATPQLRCDSCDKPSDFVAYNDVKEAFGWPKLEERSTTQYFYDGPVMRSVTTKENFTYNSVNKKVATYETTNSGSGESIKKVYNYYTGPNNQISEMMRIKSYEEGLFAGLDVIERGTTGNSANLPIKIRREKKEVSDAAADIAQEIISYDPYGNITTMTDGPALGGLKTYIWGYNNTLPIAAIEGAKYDDLMANPTIAGLIVAAQQQSNKANNPLYLFTPLETLESDLRTALITLRDALPQYMVTSFTHKPLIGVTSILDQRDNRTYYEYDEFNRLSAVYDKEKKLLSENKYNYKNPQ